MWSQTAALDIKGQGGKRVYSQHILTTLILLFSSCFPAVHLLVGFCFTLSDFPQNEFFTSSSEFFKILFDFVNTLD